MSGLMLTFHANPKHLESAGDVTGDVTSNVTRLLLVCNKAMSRRELREALMLKGEDHFRRQYLIPALASGYIEMTIPDKPKSRLQRYRLTETGAELLKTLQKPGKQ